MEEKTENQTDRERKGRNKKEIRGIKISIKGRNNEKKERYSKRQKETKKREK
jgi:hypothetical protein